MITLNVVSQGITGVSYAAMDAAADRPSALAQSMLRREMTVTNGVAYEVLILRHEDVPPKPHETIWDGIGWALWNGFDHAPRELVPILAAYLSDRDIVEMGLTDIRVIHREYFFEVSFGDREASSYRLGISTEGEYRLLHYPGELGWSQQIRWPEKHGLAFVKRLPPPKP